MPVFDGEKVVMRLLPETARGFTLEQLGLRGKALEDVQDNLRKASWNDISLWPNRVLGKLRHCIR
jgi:hypothetical protein